MKQVFEMIIEHLQKRGSATDIATIKMMQELRSEI